MRMVRSWQLHLQSWLRLLTIPSKVSTSSLNNHKLSAKYADLDPNNLGRLRYLQTPLPSQYLPIQNYPLPRNVYYLSKKVVLVVFFGYVGIMQVTVNALNSQSDIYNDTQRLLDGVPGAYMENIRRSEFEVRLTLVTKIQV